MPQIQSIRSRRRNGESIASIARSERVSEPTVRKYLRVDDLSARPPVRRRRGSVIDEWLPMIEGMLAEDRETWRKQRHTATRIHERLRDEYGAGVSLSTVTRTVARLRREAAAEREAGFLDLSWHPGECQADFGQVDVRYRGVVTRMRHFVLDFPYSNIGPSQLMPGENAECTCQALRNLFEWLGGVPERIVYDNAAGVGRKWFDGIRLTRLFQAFQAHYGFEYSFCNPYSGHEKGAVEARVGAVRRRLFVPVPGVWSLDGFNLRLPDRCLELGDKDHYRKGESQAGLFEDDRKALLPLPAKPFDVVTWTRMKADKYGNVTVQGRHRYAAGPEHAGHEMIVGLRALEVEILDAEGKRVITHPRSYGDKPTDSGDPSSQLGLLCDRPAAWRNSRVRDAMPDPLREWIDVDRYNKSEANYDSSYELLDRLQKLFPNIGLDDQLDGIQSLKDSKEAYKNGKNLQAQGEDGRAITEYQKVIHADVNHDDAQTQIQNIRTAYKEKVLSDAQSRADEKDFLGAEAILMNSADALFDIGISFFFYRYCCCRILAFKNRPYICWLNLTIGVDTIQFCLAIIDVLCLDSICIDLDIFCSSFQSFIFTGINEFNPVK